MPRDGERTPRFTTPAPWVQREVERLHALGVRDADIGRDAGVPEHLVRAVIEGARDANPPWEYER